MSDTAGSMSKVPLGALGTGWASGVGLWLQNRAPRTGPILGAGVAPEVGIRPAGVGCFLLSKVDMVVTAIGVG